MTSGCPRFIPSNQRPLLDFPPGVRFRPSISSELFGKRCLKVQDSSSKLSPTLTKCWPVPGITGSSFQIQNGVYFVRGQFCNVNQETLILNQYDSGPLYRVGLFVNEEIINADIDESLNDLSLIHI